MIFAREASEPLTALLKKMDELNVKYKKQDLGTCAIFIDKSEGVRSALKKMASKAELKQLIVATLDAPPNRYEINKEADVTVLIYKGIVVKANHSFRKGELDDKAIEAMVGDVIKMMGAK